MRRTTLGTADAPFCETWRAAHGLPTARSARPPTWPAKWGGALRGYFFSCTCVRGTSSTCVRGTTGAPQACLHYMAFSEKLAWAHGLGVCTVINKYWQSWRGTITQREARNECAHGSQRRARLASTHCLCSMLPAAMARVRVVPSWGAQTFLRVGAHVLLLQIADRLLEAEHPWVAMLSQRAPPRCRAELSSRPLLLDGRHAAGIHTTLSQQRLHHAPHRTALPPAARALEPCSRPLAGNSLACHAPGKSCALASSGCGRRRAASPPGVRTVCASISAAQ